MVGQLFLLLTLGSRILLRATLGHRLSILWEGSRGVNRREGMDDRTCTYVSLIPLTEGGRIDLDDGALDEGVRPDKLVVGSVIHLKWTISDEHAVWGCDGNILQAAFSSAISTSVGH